MALFYSHTRSLLRLHLLEDFIKSCWLIFILVLPHHLFLFEGRKLGKLSIAMSLMYVTFAVLFSVMVIADLVGNALVILVVLKNTSMKTPVNYLLVNLAAADILVGVFFGIQFIITPAITHPGGATGDLLCKFVTGGVPGWIGAVTSVFSLVAIAIERYCAVIFPHSQRGKLTKTKVVIFAVVSWILAILWAGVGFFITVFNKEINGCVHSWPEDVYANIYTVGWTVVAGIIPLGIMGVLYSRVVHRLWFASQSSEVTQRAMLRYRRRVTKLVIAVTVVYALCWIPELTIYFLGFTGTIILKPIHFSVASALVFFNSTINPVVYSLQSSTFRTHFWNLICCKKGRRSNRVHPALEADPTMTEQGGTDQVIDESEQMTPHDEQIITAQKSILYTDTVIDKTSPV